VQIEISTLEDEEGELETLVNGATPPALPDKNWFQRNWKWFVPSGCLTIILLFLAFFAGVLSIAELSLKGNDAYAQAMARAQASPQVATRIGLPLKVGWFVSGSINTSGDSGDADLSIPISGPKGKGKILVVAKKVAGSWQFETLRVEVDSQRDQIDLLQPVLLH
jgi:hypothetical protein